MKERRLKEEAEKIHGKPQYSAPPSVFRSSRPDSARSSGYEFGDAKSLQDWYSDEERMSPTRRERHEQVYEPKASAKTPEKANTGTGSGLDSVQ